MGLVCPPEDLTAFYTSLETEELEEPRWNPAEAPGRWVLPRTVVEATTGGVHAITDQWIHVPVCLALRWAGGGVRVAEATAPALPEAARSY